MNIKRSICRAYSRLQRIYWRARKGRVITAMGETYKVSPDTVFPTHRRLRLPKGHCRSEIVRYADFVQMHACCQYLAGLHRPTIVDVGAHHGAYAIVLGNIARQKSGKLIAIEPSPENFKILGQNVRMNGLEETVALEQAAVTPERCTVGLSLHGSESCLVECGGPSSIDVRGEPLEDMLSRHKIAAVDLLIIDVEGAGLPVLRSIPWNAVPVGRIFCEVHPYNWGSFGYSGKDFERFFVERRLKCMDMYLTEHRFFQGREYVGPCLLYPHE